MDIKKPEIIKIGAELLGLNQKETEEFIKKYDNFVKVVSDRLEVDEKNKSAKAKIGETTITKKYVTARSGLTNGVEWSKDDEVVTKISRKIK